MHAGKQRACIPFKGTRTPLKETRIPLKETYSTLHLLCLFAAVVRSGPYITLRHREERGDRISEGRKGKKEERGRGGSAWAKVLTVEEAGSLGGRGDLLKN